MIYYDKIFLDRLFDCNFYLFHIQMLANKLKYSLGQSGTVDGDNAEMTGDSVSISESSISSALDDDG